MSERTRWTIFILICVVAYVLYFRHLTEKQKLERERLALVEAEKKKDAEAREREAEERRLENAAMAAANGTPGAPPVPVVARVADAPVTELQTDLFRVRFTHLGARALSWQLRPAELVVNKPAAGQATTSDTLELIPQTKEQDRRQYPFALRGGVAERFNRVLFDARIEREKAGAQRLVMTSLESVRGVRVRKEWLFQKDSYAVEHRVTFMNGPETKINMAADTLGVGTGWLGGFGAIEGADRTHGIAETLVALGNSLEARSLKADSQPIEATAEVAWVGISKKFFAAAIVPSPKNPAVVARAFVEPRDMTDEYTQTPRAVPPQSVEILSAGRMLDLNESHVLDYTVFVGPASGRLLKSLEVPMREGGAPLASIAFHTMPPLMGWARPFAVGLLTILIWLQGIIQKWGVTVMVLTTLVKLAVLPLAYWAMKMSARTMYEQQKIKPELDALNKKYADDPQARSAAMLKLYRDHNINPAGALRGCLPAFAQMPVFVGLYALFDQAVELRGQEFLWIADLSQPDRLFSWGINLPILGPAFNILPVLMGITQYLSMKTMQLSQPTDEMQAQIQKNMMTVMPVMFTFLMFQMPAGLLLYWCTSNTWSIAQGWVTKKYVDRKIEEYRAAERVAVAVPARPRR